ncbi:MAG TPA: hypothetical protein VGQ52_03370 [Gemmatimonadaceae bacterium]|jgi:hypothetical protein|nr:hypothetical protein [Gemmatimonadaceae bacterium]
MATRWSYSRLCLTAALLAACVSTTVREFYPSPENPRYTPERGSAAVREYLRLRCADLKPPARDSATLLARIRVDSTGKVVAAELSSTTGDPLMDGVIGTVVAQLDLAIFDIVGGAPTRVALYTKPRTNQARVEYACRDSVGARIVISQ